MKLCFIGADHEVTGSCHYIEACDKKILVDYGMEQGKDYFENSPLPVSAGNRLCISHGSLTPKIAETQ